MRGHRRPRPNVVIATGAVLFANNARVFSTRKACLTYGTINSVEYDSRDSEHVRRCLGNPFIDHDSQEMIEEFSTHVIRGDDVPVDGAFPMQSYAPLRRSQENADVEIRASHEEGH